MLEPGPTLSGRLLDLHGRPIAGQKVVARGTRNPIQREAITAADGTFRFAPLRPGSYDVFGERQAQTGGLLTAPLMPNSTPVIMPVRVALRKEPFASVELHETPSIKVEVRYVDARGRPARGNPTSLSGKLPKASAPQVGKAAAPARINAKAPQNGQLQSWDCQLSPDAEGRIVFRVPRGLTNVRLLAYPVDEAVAYQARFEAGGPLYSWGGDLGTLNSDRSGIEIISYRSPTVLTTITTEGGEPLPKSLIFRVSLASEEFGFDEQTILQTDGRYRTRSLMPHRQYQFHAMSEEYVPKRVEWLRLPEGATARVNLVLRNRLTPPLAGASAPPFLIKTLDGREWKLDDFRGSWVLLYTWSPLADPRDKDIPRLNAIRQRFGPDRLAMLGLCFSSDTEAARKLIESRRLTWPQAILRDELVDPFFLDYAPSLYPLKSFLIGPKGELYARDLEADKLEETIAKALDGD